MAHPKGSPIRVLQVGYGGVGRRRADIIAAAPGAVLVGVADPDSEALIAARARFESPAIAVDTDYRVLLDRLRPDAVILSTPNALHAPAAIAALRAGAHVLIEKPMTPTPAAADAIAAAALSADRLVKLGANHMVFPAVEAALHVLAQGRLGALQSVQVRIGHGRFLSLPAWFRDPKRCGGGTLLDNGSHALLFICAALAAVQDEVCTLDAQLTWRDGVDVHARCHGQSRAGVGLQLESTWIAPQDVGYLFDLTLVGATATLRVDNPGHAWLESSGDVTPLPIVERGPSWALDTQDFLDAIAEGRAPAFGLAAGQALAALHARCYGAPSSAGPSSAPPSSTPTSA